MQLPRSSLRQFLELSKPYANRVRTPPSRQDSPEAKVRASEGAIRAALAENSGGWPTEALFGLRKALEIAVYLEEASVAQWLLLQTIFETLREINHCKTSDDEVAWSTALGHAVEAINANWFRPSMMRNSREEVVADALRVLRRKGFDVRVDGHGAQIVPSHFTRLCKQIEKKIKRVGGFETANALLNRMRRMDLVKDGSLIHARTPQMLANKQATAGTPWHYLYSVSIKHLDQPGKAGNSAKVLESMGSLARLLAAAIDVEPHSSFENMSIAPSSLAEVLNDTLVYDELFAFPQWQPLAARELVRDWFSSLDAEGCRFPIMPSGVWSIFADRLQSCSRPDALVPLEIIDTTRIGMTSADVQTLIAACCAKLKEANTNYLTPAHTGARTASCYPILPGTNGIRYVQPEGMVVRALCERVYSLMRRDKVPDLENRMGRALERLTATVLRRAGYEIAVWNGKYPDPHGGADLEIDLAIEAPDHIFLFECKKKPLTNAARRGETLAALNDLEKSFLYLVQQLARHEAALRSQGRISFRDGSVLSLDGRRVEKFCISLFDHGSLQHRDMTMAMMDALVGKRIKIDHPDAVGLENAINGRLDNIENSLRTILGAQPGKADNVVHAFAMSTWWLSVDQLQYAILKGGDLWSGVERVRHLTRRSGDLIYEILTTARLNGMEEAMFELNKKMDNRSIL